MSLYRRHLFPRMLDWVMQDARFAALRQNLLAHLSGHILEIGFGSGLNLAHYPRNIASLTTIEPNGGMAALAQKRIAHFPSPFVSHLASGEKLPFPDKTFDVALSTWTLCSVASVEKTLDEITRTLKQGGRFYFLEHGLSDNRGTQKWQHRLNPLQRFCADGCNLDRDMEALISASPLNLEELKKFEFKGAPGIISPHYKGWAAKE